MLASWSLDLQCHTTLPVESYESFSSTCAHILGSAEYNFKCLSAKEEYLLLSNDLMNSASCLEEGLLLLSNNIMTGNSEGNVSYG